MSDKRSRPVIYENLDALNKPRPTVQTFLVYEPPRTAAGGNASPLTSALGAKLAKALGSLKADRACENVYYVEEGCNQVRQTLPVDRFYLSTTLNPSDDVFERNMNDMYASEVKPLLDRLFRVGEDAVVVVAGYSGTPARARQVHGSTLDLPTAVTVNADSSFRFVAPPRKTWGLLLRTVEDTLQHAAKIQASVSASAVRIQLDNVVDALISSNALKVKFGDADQGNRVRQQYTRLLALTSASTLDVEDDAGIAKIADQTTCSLSIIDDFFHIINCFSAAAAAKQALMQGNAFTSGPGPAALALPSTPVKSTAQKGSAPAHSLTTLRIVLLTGEVRRFHFLELADVDWVSPSKEDQAEHQASIDVLVEVLGAMQRSNDLVMDTMARKSLLTHILCSQLRAQHTNILFYGHARYASSLSMMHILARVSAKPIRTVLHGPDLEGEQEVDAELRAHLEEIQRECEALQQEYEDMLERKKSVERQMQSTDEKVARIEQRRATIRRMSFATKKKLITSTDLSQKSLEAADSKRGRTFSLKERDLMNAAKCYTLREELRDLEKTHAKVMRTAEKQMDILQSELRRGQAKVAVMQSEHDKLRDMWKQSVIDFDKKRETAVKEQLSKVATVLEGRRREAELATQNQRRLQAAEQDALRDRTAAMIRSEQEAEEKLRSSQALRVEQLTKEAELELAIQRRTHELQRELLDIDEKIQQEISADERERASHTRRLHELEQAAAILNDWAFRMTSCLSTSEKRMRHHSMIHLAVHEPHLKETASVIQKRTQVIEAYLNQGGINGPPLRGSTKVSPASSAATTYL